MPAPRRSRIPTPTAACASSARPRSTNFGKSITLKPEHLADIAGDYLPTRASWNFPDPWPGGSWRPRDAVDYQLSATRALLEHAAKNREYWLRTSYRVLQRACSRRQPFAFVIPAAQKDPFATSRLLEVLGQGAVEVQRAQAAFEVGGRVFPAGSHVVPTAQPASAFARALLEHQQASRRPRPGAYDSTYTLPLLLGVEVVSLPSPFTAPVEPIDPGQPIPGRVEGEGRSYALGHRSGEMKALGRLLRAGVSVRWARTAFSDAGRRFAAGTLLVPAAARRQVAALCRELGITARGVEASPAVLTLRPPRVAVYRSWSDLWDDGWTRFVFDHEMDVAYETLRGRDVREENLRARYDVIVLPDEPPETLLHGKKGTPAEPRWVALGTPGMASLKSFVEDGGTLIALNKASKLVIQAFPLTVADALTNDAARPEAERVTSPGAILTVKLDSRHPLAHGLDDGDGTLAVWFEEGPAFDSASGAAVAWYEDEDPLLSGWLQGGPRLKGRAALVEARLGKGRVVLFGFRPQFRAQSWASYVLLLNAVYTAAASPAP